MYSVTNVLNKYKLGFPINVPGATVEYAHTQCTRDSYNEGSIISSQHIKWHIGVSRGKVLFYKFIIII